MAIQVGPAKKDIFMANLSDEEPKENKCIEIIKKYFIETSIHGLKYIFENGRHVTERIFWLIACGCLWAIGFFLIAQIIQKWQDSPVLVSFDSKVTPIWEIPFPAVTICNMNKVRKSRVEYVEAQKAANPSEIKWHHELLFIDEVCHGQGHTSESASEAESEEINIDGKELHKLLADFAHPCDRMILRCRYGGHERNCSNLFRPVITDEGQCCTFNMAPESMIFRKEQLLEEFQATDEEIKLWGRWDVQNGYKDGLPPPIEIEHGEDIEEKLKDEPMPRRGVAPGRHSGLSLLLNAHVDDYFCSGGESVGFKALFHSPSVSPELVEFGFAIATGTENFMPINAEVIYAQESVHGISHTKKACFLQDEKYLRYFQAYAFSNCMTECLANYTYQECECVDYYMPRDQNSMPICSPSKVECIEEAIEVVEASAYDPEGPVGKCECIPACTEMKFPFKVSTSKLNGAKGLHVKDKLKTDFPDLEDDKYVDDNVAIVHIFHEDSNFLKNQRAELFSIVDLLSYVGGVLGLCLGFSAMSALECIYFFTLRLGLNIRYRRDEPDVVGSLFES